jgi:large subunit ribosomal protein L4
MRQGALASALSLKLKQGQLLIVDTFELAEIKTKKLASILRALNAEKSLIVDAVDNENLKNSARNMTKSQFLPPEGVNLYDVLRHENLILTKDAATQLQNRLANGERS